MPLVLRGNTYWVDIRHNGKRVRKTTGTSDQKKAQRIYDRIKAELWENKHLDKPVSRSFADAIDKWLTENSHKKSIHETARHLSWLNDRIGGKPLHTITEATIENLIEDKQRSGVSNATVNRLLSALSVVLNAAYKWKWINQAPAIRRLQEAKAPERFFDRTQVVRLVAELPWHLSCIFTFALVTGQRMSNVLGLRWDRVDAERRHMWITSDEYKGGFAHGIPLNDDALAILGLLRGDHEVYVFTYRGHPIKRVSSQRWYAALDAAEIPRGRREGFTFHHTRHTWASFHTMNGTPKQVLQHLGGWKTPTMVDRYGHLAPGFAAEYAGNIKINR